MAQHATSEGSCLSDVLAVGMRNTPTRNLDFAAKHYIAFLKHASYTSEQFCYKAMSTYNKDIELGGQPNEMGKTNL